MMAAQENRRPLEILLVEDNAFDARLTADVLRENAVATHLSVVKDGEEAMAFLRRAKHYAAAPRPDLILLDLNVPKKTGHEVLAEIKTDPALRRIPVIVLTASDQEQDVARGYDLHANCYVRKPLDLTEFERVMQAIDAFWFRTAQLPKA